MDNSLNVDEEWTLEFNRTTYIVTVLVSEMTLTLELENLKTSQRWSGRFTAEYLVDTTQKAGNVKDFPVFVHLLKSALNGGDESAHIDILTFSDLELLKAKKLAEKGIDAGHRHHTSPDSRDKRYVILTYLTKLDKVHYPIPLSIEDTPNVPALRRTIRKLRDKLASLEGAEPQFNNEKERELRQMVSQFRQENQELRHRLRQSESRNNKAVNQSLNISSNNLNSSIVASTDLATVNVKLQKKIETLKADLTGLSSEHEKLKQKYNVDVARLKQKIGLSPGMAGFSGNEVTPAQSELMNMVQQLRTRLIQTERELRTLKLSVGQPVTRNKSELTKGYAPVYTRPSDVRRSRSLSAGRGNASASSRYSPGATTSWNNAANVNSSRLTYASNTSRYAAHTTPLSGEKHARELAAEAAYRRQSLGGTPTHSRHSSPLLSRQQQISQLAVTGTPPSMGRLSSGGSSGSRNTTPTRARPGSAPGPTTGASPSSSSLGGRFDPTAYQQEKAAREREAAAAPSRAWGAGSANGRRYPERSPSPTYRGESGYASGHSQSSRGSRHSANAYHSDSSAGSHRSRGSQASAGSGTGGRKKKSGSKKTKKSTSSAAPAAEKKGSTAAAPKTYYIVSGGADSEDEEVLRNVKLQRQSAALEKTNKNSSSNDKRNKTASTAVDSQARHPSPEFVREMRALARVAEEGDDLLDVSGGGVSAVDSSAAMAELIAEQKREALRALAASSAALTSANATASAVRRSIEAPAAQQQQQGQQVSRSRGNSFESDVSDMSHSHHPSTAAAAPLSQYNRDSAEASSGVGARDSKLDRIKQSMKYANHYPQQQHQSLSMVSSVDTSSTAGGLSAIKENLNYSTRNSAVRSSGGNAVSDAVGRNSYDSTASVSSVQSEHSVGGLGNMSEIDKRISSLQSYLDNARSHIHEVR